MLKKKQIVKLSNLINDCVVLIQQAGNIVLQASNESPYSNIN